MRTQKNRPAGAAAKPAKITVEQALSIIRENPIYASGVCKWLTEAVENGSARLTAYYTGGRPTGFTTSHSNRLMTDGGGNGK